MRGRLTAKAAAISIALAACSTFSATSLAQAGAARSPASQTEQVDEIFVTARRSGIPVWKVTGPKSTVLLVGAIDEVSKATKWEPGSLASALRKADRVMFPQAVQLTLSPFAMFGLAVKVIRMSKLPKGQTVAAMLPPAQFSRLVALQRKGVLKPGFERLHPLMLAISLQDYGEGKAGTGTDAHRYVQRTIKKYKIRQVPIPKLKARKPLNAVIESSPQAHIPCLVASIGMAEAGPGALQARSDAWAQRRVKDALTSPAHKAFEACSLDHFLEERPDWRGTLWSVFADPQLTVAVLELGSLAEQGGVLDELARAGYEIKGPAWK